MAFEELLVKLVSRLDDAGFKQLDKMETHATKQTQILSNSLRNMFVGIVGTIGVREILDASVKMDSLKTSFAALAGSGDAGAAQLSYVREEADRLGQEFYSTAEAYKNLFSAGMGANMDVEEIQNIFSAVMEAGTVLGSSKEQMSRALLALEQMISKGRVSMEELRQQLGEAVPGAMQIAAKAMGVTTTELQEMLEAGLDSKMFVKAFADQLHRDFGGKATEAAHTLRAELNRLESTIFQLEASFLDGEAGEAFADTIRQLVIVLKSPELQSSLQGISQGLTFLLKHIKPIMAIVGFIIGNAVIGKISKSVFGLGVGLKNGAKWLSTLIAATRGLSLLGRLRGIISLLWWALNPLKKIELVIWGIVAAIAGIKKLKDYLESFKADWQETSDGRVADANPKSKTFMRTGEVYYTVDDVKKALYATPKFSDMFDTTGVPNDLRLQKSFGEGRFQTTNYNNDIKINITARSDNPQEIGDAVYTAIENARIYKGYAQTAIV